MEVIALTAALIVAVLALAWVLSLYLKQRDALAARDRVPVAAPPPRTEIREVPVIQEVVRYVEAPEPDALIAGADDLSDPTVLPDVPDGVPDSIADGARIGSLTVRAASTRGAAGRKEAKLRHQTAALIVLGEFSPPVLLSVAAAGLPGTQRPQIGAAQACRSIAHKVSDAVVAVQAAWPAGADHDQRLTECLRGALRATARPLADAARSRGFEPQDVATELTCVLTKLGDGSRRMHLAFGVGAGRVLVLRPDAAPRTVLGADDNGGGPADASLPGDPEAVQWARFETVPGDLVLACTAPTVPLLDRDGFRRDVISEWLTAPPRLSRFLAQLNYADQFCTEDRSAIALWEVKPHYEPAEKGSRWRRVHGSASDPR